jgi:hypothetical protein
MPFLQGSGSISIANLNGFFPGGGTSMSNFYRGGGRVPATKTVTTTVREPSTGFFYSAWHWFWLYSIPGQAVQFWWQGSNLAGWVYGLPNATSYTIGAFTYLRGDTMFFDNKGNATYHGIARISQSSSTANINTGIPSSGQISLSQFFGAETP